MSRVFSDVVIVGGGVVGCSAAFHLSQPRGARVIVVEKGSLASGMTKRSGALIHTSFTHAPEARLALASLRYFQDWKEIVGGSCGFTQTGCAIVTGNETAAAKLREQIAALWKIGSHTRVISLEQLRELAPGARVDDLTLAAYEAEAGYADPVETTRTLAARAKERGVAFKTGTLVKGIRVNMGRVSGVDTTTGEIDALTVVVIAGAWTDRLLKPLGVEIGIQNTRAQVVFFERPAELKAGHAAFIDGATGAHFRPHTFGLTMGGLNTPQGEEKDPDHFDEHVAPEFVADVRQRIAARLPALAQARYIRGHAGIYDTSPDARPVISRVPGIEGLIVAAGFSGEGFALAPAVGACVAEMITDGAARSVDLRPLQLNRFSKNDTVTG